MDENYYISHGGKVPVKWTAPEVCVVFILTTDSPYSFVVHVCCSRLCISGSTPLPVMCGAMEL